MRQFLSNEMPTNKNELEQIRDLLGRDDGFVSVEEAAEAAAKEMMAVVTKRREAELKNSQDA